MLSTVAISTQWYSTLLSILSILDIGKHFLLNSRARPFGNGPIFQKHFQEP